MDQTSTHIEYRSTARSSDVHLRSHEPTAAKLSAAITALRAAAESADGEAVGELLAPDVVFHSPLTSRIRFQGKDEVAALHRDIFAVVENLSTTESLTRGDTGAFSFSGHVRGQRWKPSTWSA